MEKTGADNGKSKEAQVNRIYWIKEPLVDGDIIIKRENCKEEAKRTFLQTEIREQKHQIN